MLNPEFHLVAVHEISGRIVEFFGSTIDYFSVRHVPDSRLDNYPDQRIKQLEEISGEEYFLALLPTGMTGRDGYGRRFEITIDGAAKMIRE